LPPPPTASVVSAPITAEEAARIALVHQPSLGLSVANVQSAQGRAEVQRAGLLPTGTVGTEYDYYFKIHGPTGGGNTGSVTNTGWRSTLQISQLAFDFNHTVDAVRQYEALEKSARWALSQAQNDLVLNVKNDFYTFVQDTQLVHVQEANLASNQASLALAKAQELAGIGEPANVVTAQTNVATAALALAQAQQTALNARTTLALQMGIDPRTPIAAAASEEPAPAGNDVNALVDTAIKNRPEIRVYRESLRAAGYEVSWARTTDAPAINVLGIGSSGGNSPIGAPVGGLGINLSWNFLDFGRQGGLVKEAQADVLTAKSNLQTYSLSIINDVSQAYVNLRSAEQQLEIANSAVANGQEAVRLAEGRFRAGVGLYVDIVVAQATLVQAQTQQANAQAAIQQSRAALRHAMGAI
jgi:outer membrane protein